MGFQMWSALGIGTRRHDEFIEGYVGHHGEFDVITIEKGKDLPDDQPGRGVIDCARLAMETWQFSISDKARPNNVRIG